MVESTYNDRTDMVLIYAEAVGNATRTRRIYMKRYLKCDTSDSRTFSNTIKHLKEYRTFKSHFRVCARDRTLLVLEFDPAFF